MDKALEHLLSTVVQMRREAEELEKEDDVIWTYMEIEKCEKPNQINISNSLLYDFLKEQINLVQVEVGTYKQSSKVTNPEREMKFTVTN